MLNDIERQLEHHATGRYSADYRHPADCVSDALRTRNRAQTRHEHRRKVRRPWNTAPRRKIQKKPGLARSPHRRFGHFIDGGWQQPPRRILRHHRSFHRREARRRRPRVRRGHRRRGSSARAAALPEWQALTPHARARYLYALREPFRSIRAASRFSKPSTTASRSARAATSIFRW